MEYRLQSMGLITLHREKELFRYCKDNQIIFARQTMSPAGIVILATDDKVEQMLDDFNWLKIFNDNISEDILLIEVKGDEVTYEE